MHNWTSSWKDIDFWSELHRTRWTSCTAVMTKLEEKYICNVCAHSFATWNVYFSILDELSWPWGCFAHTFCWVFAWRKQICIVVSMEFLVHASQSHLAQQHQTCVVGRVGETVVGWFGDHVGKVHALSEHIASNRCLRRCYPQTLTQNTNKIGQPRSMP